MKILRVALCFLLTPLFSSCIESIVFDDGQMRKPVVHCVLVNDSIQTMRLFWSKKVGERECLPLVDVNAFILKLGDSGQVVDTSCVFQHYDGDVWKAKMFPLNRQKYQLVVACHKGDTLTATTTMPDRYSFLITEKGIPSWLHNESVSWSYSYKIVALRPGTPFATLKDPVETSYVWMQGCTEYGHRIPGTYTSLKWYDDPNSTFADHITTDHLYVDDFNVTGKTVSDLKYLYNLDIYPEQDNWRLVLCPDLPLHKEVVRIVHPVGYSNGLTGEELKNSPYFSKFDFTLTVELDETKVRGGQSYDPVVASFVSYEYDRYLKDVYTRHFNDDNFIMSLYDTDNIYSNISGGCGIFGAKYVHPEKWIKKTLFP